MHVDARLDPPLVIDVWLLSRVAEISITQCGSGVCSCG